MATEHNKPGPTGNSHSHDFDRPVEQEFRDRYGLDEDLLGAEAIVHYHPHLRQEKDDGT
jgi:hypothetical protein